MATKAKMLGATARIFARNLSEKPQPFVAVAGHFQLSAYSSPSLSPLSSVGSSRDADMAVARTRLGLELLGAKDYYDYRRSLYGDITHKALLVDAVGTLVVPSQPTAQIYRMFGEKYGVEYSEAEILSRYRWAYEQPWCRSRLSALVAAGGYGVVSFKGSPFATWKPFRDLTLIAPQQALPMMAASGYGFLMSAGSPIENGSHFGFVNDGRPFWEFIVKSSTGCSDSRYFEELYQYYMTEKAWHICDPNAERVFMALRNAGVKLAVVSNFDTRLRPLLQAMKCDHWFDAVAVSAEVEAEKPNPTIFMKACELLGVNPEDAVHVGDDRRNDIWGARDAGCDAWLWGSDVLSFKEVAQRIGVHV